MGMKGAAIATVIARAITFVASISVLHFKYKMLDFKKPKFIDAFNSWKKILYIAIPAAGANIINPIILFVVTGIVARFGETSVAAFGVVSKLESFAMIFITSSVIRRLPRSTRSNAHSLLPIPLFPVSIIPTP